MVREDSICFPSAPCKYCLNWSEDQWSQFLSKLDDKLLGLKSRKAGVFERIPLRRGTSLSPGPLSSKKRSSPGTGAPRPRRQRSASAEAGICAPPAPLHRETRGRSGTRGQGEDSEISFRFRSPSVDSPRTRAHRALARDISRGIKSAQKEREAKPNAKAQDEETGHGVREDRRRSDNSEGSEATEGIGLDRPPTPSLSPLPVPQDPMLGDGCQLSEQKILAEVAQLPPAQLLQGDSPLERLASREAATRQLFADSQTVDPADANLVFGADQGHMVSMGGQPQLILTDLSGKPLDLSALGSLTPGTLLNFGPPATMDNPQPGTSSGSQQASKPTLRTDLNNNEVLSKVEMMLKELGSMMDAKLEKLEEKIHSPEKLSATTEPSPAVIHKPREDTDMDSPSDSNSEDDEDYRREDSSEGNSSSSEVISSEETTQKPPQEWEKLSSIKKLSQVPSDASAMLDTSRVAAWNDVAGVVKETSDNWTSVTPSSPLKRKHRVEDPNDPKGKAEPVRFPVHKDIQALLDLIKEEVAVAPKGTHAGKHLPVGSFLEIDRSVTAPYFAPSNNRKLLTASRIGEEFFTLAPRASRSPAKMKVSDKQLQDQEEIWKQLLCIRNAKRWIEETAAKAITSLKEQEPLREYLEGVELLLSINRSMSIMEEDRIVTELGNTMLRRRDLRLEQLPHGTSDVIKRKMREANFDSKYLFGDKFSDLLKEESERRKEDLIFTLPTYTPRDNTSKTYSSNQKKRAASSPPRGSAAPYQKKFNKNKFSRKGKKYNSNFQNTDRGAGQARNQNYGRGRGQSNYSGQQDSQAPSYGQGARGQSDHNQPFQQSRSRGRGRGNKE